MKYSELIQFDPIESVVQLHEANREADARRLVETFVISKRMAEILSDLVIPHLQYDKPADNRGLLVVGNYGTGKSHLMALVSAVAEHGDLADSLTDDTVKTSAAPIAGRFKVIRAEIGSTLMSLRDILCGVLEDGLSKLGVDYAFPDASERHENKLAFQEMMAAFQAQHPDQGLLLVLDELLDFLRSRDDQALSLDLSFLREIGEVCKGTRFRFIAGVQESLFDNPRFQFVADTLKRVKDRFEQVRIARDDVAYVVAERLLKKSDKQRAMIREHLTAFAPYYGTMNERMDEFVRLFPVHPAYLDTFEQVYVAEKREVLKTLSAAMRKLINTAVPDGEPGLIAYDSYWQVLRDNPSFRSVPEIKEVIEKTSVLQARIEQAFTRPQYRPAALRVVHALAVHRLTTSDIYTSLGVTADELRDDLCLLLPVPEKDAGFLKTMVETVLKEIVRTVSGQFLSFNAENGQYFLDLKKDVDFDSLIEKKAETLSKGQLDRYYFDALRRVVLEDPDATPYVGGYRIWEHEVEWRERHAGRSGYLFFGAPNERSTAQPPRDFYLYFLQPFDPPYFKDEKKSDEAFFKLRHRDDAFDQALRLYAGARELMASASGGNKKIYEEKALKVHLKALTTWLLENMTTAFDVEYQGTSKGLTEVVQGKVAGGLARATVRDFVNSAASVLLSPHFEDKSPDYPIFTVPVTRNNRGQAAQDALRWIGGSVKSKQGTAILDALELLDSDKLTPRTSSYSQHILELMEQKGHGQVLNRSELIQEEYGVEYWTRFRLEPEFLAVVLAALVHSGDIVLSIPGKKIDAAALEQFAKLPVRDVADFRHLERPKDLPLAALQDLCDLLGVPKGLIVNPAKRAEAVTRIQQSVQSLLERVARAIADIAGLMVWGKPVLSAAESDEWRERLASLKSFLESLQPFNTEGKLKNFPHDSKKIADQQAYLDRVKEVEELSDLIGTLAPQTAYLEKGEALLQSGHPWLQNVSEKRGELLTRIGSPKYRADPAFHRTIGQTLAELKTQYQDAYLAAHTKARLGANDDKKKGQISGDERVNLLRRLAGIEMMPAQHFCDLENRLLGLDTCFALTRQDLDRDPKCPHCSFRPADESVTQEVAQVLVEVDDLLDEMVTGWTGKLQENLQDPIVVENIDLVSDDEGRRAIQEFVKTGEMPAPLGAPFLKALQEVLSGLQKVSITAKTVGDALAKGGLPCTVNDLRERFDTYLAKVTKGKDASKVRVVVE